MGIYRGPGGSGDAVNDSSSETRLAVEARDAALAAQAAAEAAQAAAEDAQLGAETALANIDDSEAQAETAATNAASSASSASTSATNAASSASSASTSATNAASSASSASSSASAASTSASNAASSASSASSSASSASTSATNAANSASAASTSETNASNSATAAASSASSASSSASTATTQASNASTSATNAASSASSASSSASTATSQAATALVAAGNAATSATNAASSASVASTSASNAATSATAAQAAQAAAEAAFDAFDDIYLGAKSSNPTVDNDGNALTTGDQYFNTVSNELRVWNGSSWQAASTVGGTVSSLTVTGAFSANGGATLGDASGDALTINSSAVSIPNGLNFDSNTLVIDATNNRVGVGTASPSSALSVAGDIYLTGDNSVDFGLTTTGSGKIGRGDRAYVQFTRNDFDGILSFYTTTSGSGGLGERMRITDTGNIGIGTSSPNTVLDVVGARQSSTIKSIINATDSQSFAADVGGGIGFIGKYNTAGSTAHYGLIGGRKENSTDGNYAGYLAFETRPNSGNLTERMRLDSSGNLGLGVTPSAWSGYVGLQVGSRSSLAGNSTFMTLSQNYFNDGADKYIGTGNATQYYQGNGAHVWRTAPSGTAGTAITFTQAMTLDASGNLMIGRTSSSNYRAQITGSSDLLDIAGTSVSAQFHNKTADIFMLGVGSGDGIAFATNGNTTERMRITSDGYVRLASGSLGIQFNGDTAAANALDDYEEGTFTPTVSGTTTAGAGTYSAQIGKYTKVGNVVYFYAFIAWTAHTGTGNLVFTALPFTSVNTANLGPIVNIVGSSLTFSNQLYGSVLANATQGEVRTFSTGASTAAVAMDTSATIILTGFYYVS